MNAYRALKDKHQNEVNNFPIVWAFSIDRLNELIKERWGLEPTDTDKIASIGAGGFILKNDIKAFKEMLKNHKEELKTAIKADTTGNGFIFDMFNYELANHEFTYTREIEDTLNALNITYEDIESNPALKNGLNNAIDHQIKAAE